MYLEDYNHIEGMLSLTELGRCNTDCVVAKTLGKGNSICLLRGTRDFSKETKN